MTDDDSFNTQHVPPFATWRNWNPTCKIPRNNSFRYNVSPKDTILKSSEASTEYPRWESLWSSTHSCLISRQNSMPLLPRFVHVVSSLQWVLGIMINFPWVSSEACTCPFTLLLLRSDPDSDGGLQQKPLLTEQPWELKSRVNENILMILFSYL